MIRLYQNCQVSTPSTAVCLCVKIPHRVNYIHSFPDIKSPRGKEWIVKIFIETLVQILLLANP